MTTLDLCLQAYNKARALLPYLPFRYPHQWKTLAKGEPVDIESRARKIDFRNQLQFTAMRQSGPSALPASPLAQAVHGWHLTTEHSSFINPLPAISYRSVCIEGKHILPFEFFNREDFSRLARLLKEKPQRSDFEQSLIDRIAGSENLVHARFSEHEARSIRAFLSSTHPEAGARETGTKVQCELTIAMIHSQLGFLYMMHGKDSGDHIAQATEPEAMLSVIKARARQAVAYQVANANECAMLVSTLLLEHENSSGKEINFELREGLFTSTQQQWMEPTTVFIHQFVLVKTDDGDIIIDSWTGVVGYAHDYPNYLESFNVSQKVLFEGEIGQSPRDPDVNALAIPSSQKEAIPFVRSESDDLMRHIRSSLHLHPHLLDERESKLIVRVETIKTDPSYLTTYIKEMPARDAASLLIDLFDTGDRDNRGDGLNNWLWLATFILTQRQDLATIFRENKISQKTIADPAKHAKHVVRQNKIIAALSPIINATAKHSVAFEATQHAEGSPRSGGEEQTGGRVTKVKHVFTYNTASVTAMKADSQETPSQESIAHTDAKGVNPHSH